jgi:hypothetical protein
MGFFVLCYICDMGIKITEKQLSTYIRRRFQPEELIQMVKSVKEQIEEGESVGVAIYDTIRYYVSLKKPTDINDEGT